MINILRKNDNSFSVIVNDVSTKDLSMKDLFKVMKELEVKFDETEAAVMELIKNDHKIANFGVNRTFIFSKERQ